MDQKNIVSKINVRLQEVKCLKIQVEQKMCPQIVIVGTIISELIHIGHEISLEVLKIICSILFLSQGFSGENSFKL